MSTKILCNSYNTEIKPFKPNDPTLTPTLVDGLSRTLRLSTGYQQWDLCDPCFDAIRPKRHV